MSRRAPQRTPADFASADEELDATLDSLSGAENYIDFVCELFDDFTGDHVLEVGAGHGDFTKRLVASGRRVDATDLSERCLDELREAFDGDDRVNIYPLDLMAPGDVHGFDSALLVNVLEHVPDDVAGLESLGRIVRPGGAIILYVPAFEALYGEFDRRIGHYRRYRRRQLGATVYAAGLDIEVLRYVNLPGFFAWWALVKMLGRTPVDGPLVRIWDKLAMPLIRFVERRWTPPFGQSLLCVARVPER